MLFSLYKKAVKKRSTAPETDGPAETKNSTRTKASSLGGKRGECSRSGAGIGKDGYGKDGYGPSTVSRTHHTPPRKRSVGTVDRDVSGNRAKKAKSFKH